ncbi:MAG: phosphoribosyltransferase [Candidatus Nitrosocaldaceae archaeon]
MELLTLTWNDIYFKSLELAERVIRDGKVIDVIVGISRGGLVLARIFSDILDIKDLYIISAKYYKSIGERLEKPIIDIRLDIKNKNILLIDDLADTGMTLNIICEELKKNNNVITLTLYKKSISIFEPDYYLEIEDRWIIFPWDICENIREVIKKGGNPKDVSNDINLIERLVKIILLKK